MKKNSRYLSIFLAIIMVFTILPFSFIETNAVANVPTISIESSNDSAAVGDIITITVKTTENSDIIIFSGTFSYDSDCLEVIPSSKSFPQGVLGEINTNTEGKVKFAVVSVDPLDDTETDVFSISFKVLKINGTVDLSVKEVYVLDGKTEVNVTNQATSSVEPLTITCKHSYALTSTTNATCTVDGVNKYVCSVCEYKYEDVIPATGHTIVNVEAKAPTCTEVGNEAYEYCSVCDYTTYVEIPATGHTADDMVVENTSDASCGTPGSYDEVVYCFNCGLELSRETKTTETLPHAYTSKITTAPTCTETGVKTFICSVCGDEYAESINATGHSYSAVVTAPTCTEQGFTTYTCECGDAYVVDYVNALGHTLANAVEENYVAPTCTESGSKDIVVYCSVCEEEINRETETLDATGHADNDGDGYCDADNELLDPTVECECNCHKSGITKFFFKFILFFQRLFGSNKTCACGVAHY